MGSWHNNSFRKFAKKAYTHETQNAILPHRVIAPNRKLQ